MTICDNGGQIEKEKPARKAASAATGADAPTDDPAPVEPPRPQPPFKLADESHSCSEIEAETGKQCCIRRVNVDDPKGKCAKHAWEDAHFVWRIEYDLWKEREKRRREEMR